MFSTLHLFIVLNGNKLKLILPTTCIGMNNAMNLQIYLFLLLINVVLYQFCIQYGHRSSLENQSQV